MLFDKLFARAKSEKALKSGVSCNVKLNDGEGGTPVSLSAKNVNVVPTKEGVEGYAEILSAAKDVKMSEKLKTARSTASRSADITGKLAGTLFLEHEAGTTVSDEAAA